MAVVINGNGTVTGLAVGGLPDGIVDAGTLATNSVDSAELIDGSVDDSHMASISGRRNMVINGDMRVAQRGTSVSVSDGSNESYNTLDRWYMQHSSGAGGVSTMSQDTTVPNTSFANSLKIDVTTADASLDVNHAITLQHRFEAQDIANSGWDYTNSSSKLSVSFWARSVKAGTYCVFFFTKNGTSRCLVQEYTLVANTWQYVELTFKGDSSISFDNNNELGLIMGWTLAAGANRYEDVTADEWITRSDGENQGRYATSNQVNFFDSTSNDFYLTGVQLELGSTATDFEHRSYGEELALCQRYYQDRETTHGWVFTEYIDTFRSQAALHPTMRTAPGITFTQTNAMLYDIDGGLDIEGHSISANNISDKGFRVNIASVTGVETVAYANSLVWAADAEL